MWLPTCPRYEPLCERLCNSLQPTCSSLVKIGTGVGVNLQDGEGANDLPCAFMTLSISEALAQIDGLKVQDRDCGLELV